MDDLSLPEWMKEKDREITTAVFTEICTHYDLTIKDITSSRKPSNIIGPRLIVYYLLYRETTMTAKQVGAVLGGRDHKTILHGVDKVRSDRSKNEEYRKVVDGFQFRVMATVNTNKIKPEPLAEPNLGHN